MTDVQAIARFVGAWSGHSALWFEPDTPPLACDTSATIAPVARGKLVTLDYTWTYEGEPQDGRILISADGVEGVHMAWCASFHMDAELMELTGDGSGEIAADGSYRVDDSEPWGSRIEVEPRGTDAFQLRMYNILPLAMGGMSA